MQKDSASSVAPADDLPALPDGPRVLRLFVASPGDVVLERERLERVAAWVGHEYGLAVRLTVFRWEQSFYTATSGFQDQIPAPAECDIMVVIFGSRLGSPLPEGFPNRLGTGEPYPSGTAYELLSGVAAAERNGRPDVYVFRKTARPVFDIAHQAEFEEARREQARLDVFFDRWFRGPDGSYLRGFNDFATTDEFADKIGVLLRTLLDRLVIKDHALIWHIERDGPPFPGLVAFDARHNAIYFGRDRKVERAFDALSSAAAREGGRPFLLIVGPSGAGKSSLMRAGLMPRLTAPGVVENVDVWRVAVMRPGGAASPFVALARALLADGTPEEDPGGFGRALPELDISEAALAVNLETDKSNVLLLSALDTVAEAERARAGFGRPTVAKLLLLVDQLEEIFADTFTRRQRCAFADRLKALVDSGRIWIVATLRADLYESVIKELAFLALKDSGGQYDLAPPGESELADILRDSAAAAGLVYERDSVSGERLDECLLREAMGADALPLLQFLLKQLFDQREEVDLGGQRETRLTYAAYRRLGGLGGAIDKVAEDAITAPDSGLRTHDVETHLPSLLRHMVVPVRGERGGSRAVATRTLPLTEIASEPASRRLIDVLVKARLVVADVSESGGVVLRLAHERVLTSWRRAQQILQASETYLRVKTDVLEQQLRWVDRGRSGALLIPSGGTLEDAQRLLRAYRSELSDETQRFIERSISRARWRQRRAGLLTLTFASLAVVVSLLFVLAGSAQQRAERDYGAAKGAADKLVIAIAQRLRDLDGINAGTVDVIFGVVRDLMDSIRQTSDVPAGPLERAGSVLIAKIGELSGHPAVASDHRRDIDRSGAAMHYEFAETYHAVETDLSRARAEALDSLATRRALYDSGDRSPRSITDLAASYMLVGDLERRAVETAHGKDISPARDAYEHARDLYDISALGKPVPLDVELGLARVLTRLGDVSLKFDTNWDVAAKTYADAEIHGVAAWRMAPASVDANRELGWVYRKLGELNAVPASPGREPNLVAARDDFQIEVCYRQRVVLLDATNTRVRRDLGYSLQKLADTSMQMTPPDTANAYLAIYQALTTRRDLASRDPDNFGWLSDYASSLEAAVSFNVIGGRGDLALDFATVAVGLRQIVAANARAAVARHQSSGPDGQPDRTAAQALADADRRVADAERRAADAQARLHAAELPPLAEARDAVNTALRAFQQQQALDDARPRPCGALQLDGPEQR